MSNVCMYTGWTRLYMYLRLNTFSYTSVLWRFISVVVQDSGGKGWRQLRQMHLICPHRYVISARAHNNKLTRVYAHTVWKIPGSIFICSRTIYFILETSSVGFFICVILWLTWTMNQKGLSIICFEGKRGRFVKHDKYEVKNTHDLLSYLLIHLWVFVSL